MQPILQRIRRAWRKFQSKAAPQLKTGVRTVARGGFLGVRSALRFIGNLPSRTLLLFGSTAGFVVVATVVLAIALPPRETGASGQLYAAPTADPNATPVPADWYAIATDAPAEATETPLVFDPAVTLESGDTGAIVAVIQTRLMELGYMDADEPTEKYGSLTQAAVKTFQSHNDLASDGLCGQETYARLMAEDAKQYVMQRGDTGDDVEGVQQRLYELGYIAKSNITATFGQKTESGVKSFQKKNGIQSDGKVGNQTLEALYGEDPVAMAYTLGDKSDAIKTCQNRLRTLGYLLHDATGEMDKYTVSAVKSFQSAHGLVRDGTLGPQTREILLSDAAQPKVVQLGDSGVDVENIQKRLIKLGYLSGSATGYFGVKTEEAVKAFQKRNSLSQTGVVGRKVLSALNSSSAKTAPPPVTPAPGSTATPKPTPTPKPGTTAKPSEATPKPVSNASGVERLIEIAQGKLGSKYVRGAKGPNSFDCSGFVYWCLNQAGVKQSYLTSIGWRTYQKYTRITSMSSLERGDVLVFSGSTMAQGHVGIYLGGGKMIDASSSNGQVRITSTILSGTYWKNHFLMGYRIF